MESKNSIELEEIASLEMDSHTCSSSSGGGSSTTTTTTVTAVANNAARSAFVERVRAASACISSGDYTTAVRLYTEALGSECAGANEHILYGNRSAAYCRLGKYKKALQDAIKARQLKPDWSKAYYRQGIALQCQRDYADALAAFASGLAQDPKSVQLLSAFVETAMKSPLRATLEPIYRQLQNMNSLSPFVITSVIGQELLGAGHYAAGAVVLEAALNIGTSSLKLRGSVLSALSSAYWAMNKLDIAIAYMQQDLQVSISLTDSLGECRAHGNLGSAYFAKCNYKEALTEHRYQLVLAMKSQHSEQAVLALTSLGHVYSAIGDLKNALSSHQRCLELVGKLGDPLAEAREIGNVGAVHLASGDFERAIECHLEHVKLSKLLGNKAEEARAYSNLGSAYHYRRNYEQAIQFHEQVLRISQEIGDRTIESKAYAGLGHASRLMNDHLQAKRWYERQLDIALNTKDRAGEARACSNLGVVYQLLGDFDGALKLHWSHLNICKQQNDTAGIGRAYGNIGNAYSALKQFEEALKYHKLELSISKEVHDRGAEASTHGNLAIAYQSLGLYERALTHFNLHLAVAGEMKDATSEANALLNLGNYYCARKEYDRAVAHYEAYIQRTVTIGDKESQAKGAHLLGCTHLELGDHQAALRYFEVDLALSKEIQDRPSIGRAYCHLGLARAELGHLEEALEAQKYYLCTAQGEPSSKLRAMGNMADVQKRQGKFQEATRLLEKQLALARSLGDVSTEANVFAALGACQKAAGNAEEAARYYAQELVFRQGAQDILKEIASLDNLGDCYAKAGNYTLALKCFLDQLDKAEQRKASTTPEDALSSEYDSDGYYGRRRRSSDTFRDHLEACQLATKAYHNVANTRFRMGHYEEAANYFAKEETLLGTILPLAEKKLALSSAGTPTGTPESESPSSEDQLALDVQSTRTTASSSSSSAISALTKIHAQLSESRLQASRSIGDCHFARCQYEQAISTYLSFLGSSSSLVEQEQVHCLLGKCYQLVNNLAAALVSYEKRLVLAHEIGCNRTKAIAYGELGHIHRLLGNFEQAISCFKHEQELAKEPTLRLGSGESGDNSGASGASSSSMQATLDALCANLTKNATHSVPGVGLVIEAEALHGLGTVAQEMHDYERALKYHSAALSISQEIGSLELESRAYGAIGAAYSSLGNVESAIAYQEKYLSVAQVVGDLSAQVSALSALGKIHSTTGQYRAAAKYLQLGLALVEKKQDQSAARGGDDEEARICYELGMALWAVNDLQTAETHLRRSVDLIESLHLGVSAGQLPLNQPPSAFSSANSHYGSIYGGSSGSSGPSDASGSSSSSHYAAFQWSNLMQSPSKPAPLHQHLHYQGASYEALTKILIALARPTDALLIAERSRTRAFHRAKQGFKPLSISTVEQIVEMARGQNAAILYYSMTIDGSYNCWLITPKGVHFAPLVKSSREKILALLSNVQASLLQEGGSSGSPDKPGSFDSGSYGDDLEESPSLSRSLHHLNRNHFLNSSNYSLSSLFSVASSVASASTSASTSRLAPSAFVRHRSGARSSTHSLKSRSGSYSNLSLASSALTECSPHLGVSKMRRSLSSGAVARNWKGSSSLIALYDILIGPFQDQLDEESSLSQLLLVLDGDLFLVPWNMLRNEDDEYLSERYSLLVMPSLHVLRGDQGTSTLRKSSSSQGAINSLVVANPTMPNRLARGHSRSNRPLYYENPGSSREAQFVGELLSTKPLICTEASKEGLLASLASAQCIHFSSYIVDNTEGDPLKMATGLGIAISPSDVLIGDSAHQLHDHEYLLTPHDLISMGLSAKLVVISCCALPSGSSSQAGALNAMTTFSSSQALKTITSALLQAGASCVLLTLWPVPLSALQILFRIFYCSLLQGARVSAALNEAVSSIQNTSRFSHPRNWAGFLLIGSDIRLSSQVALLSSSLGVLLRTPEKSRDAMRVVLHLVEKSLQRIGRGQKNAMYTTLASIENKVGPLTQGWRELLISVGFRFEPASTNGLPACVFFPVHDPSGRLLRCSTALQAVLALTTATIHAINKLIISDSAGDLIEQLSKVVQFNTDYAETSSVHLSAYLETLHIKLWSTPGCHELYASLGFDLMEVGSNSVTLRAGKNANMRTILFALQTLQALYEKENCHSMDSSDTPTLRSNGQMVTQEEARHSLTSQDYGQLNLASPPLPPVSKEQLGGGVSSAFSLYQNRGEPDGQQVAYKAASLAGSSRSNSSTSSISGLQQACSRGGIGRSLLDSELIEAKLRQMSVQTGEEDSLGPSNEPQDYRNGKSQSVSQFSANVYPYNASCAEIPIPAPRFSQCPPPTSIAMDRQSMSSTSSIATTNTVLNRHLGQPSVAYLKKAFLLNVAEKTGVAKSSSLSGSHAIQNFA